jgi:hypothetical protein
MAKTKTLGDYKAEGHKWITLATGECYPDILKDACELCKPVLVAFSQLLKSFGVVHGPLHADRRRGGRMDAGATGAGFQKVSVAGYFGQETGTKHASPTHLRRVRQAFPPHPRGAGGFRLSAVA